MQQGLMQREENGTGGKSLRPNVSRWIMMTTVTQISAKCSKMLLITYLTVWAAYGNSNIIF